MEGKLNSNNPNKLLAVEGVRGLACLMVLLSHLTSIFFPYLHSQKPELIKSSFDETLFNYPLGFLYSGTSAVYIFFCLSGFILTYACVNKGDPVYNSAKMFLSRYFRLSIPTFFSIIICAITLIIFRENNYDMPWISQLGKNVNLDFSSIIYNALFSSIILGDASYNWVVWTMQVELFGSFLIFFAVPVINKLKLKPFIYILLGAIICANFPTKFGFGYAAFLFGASIYYLPEIKNKLLFMTLIISGLYLSGYHHKQETYTFLANIEINILRQYKVQGSFLYLMISGFLIVTACIKSNILNLITSNKLSVWLGKMSFSAYLLQMPIFYITTPIMSNYLIKNGFSYTQSALATSITCLIVIYSTSILFHKIIDSKSTAISKKIIPIMILK
ncbi:TPA: acyltransferase family protein [Proteus mirabilis]|nr:acyltransferase [Proteus mirabilis]MBI6292210.1 acyltransferase [Proteus mirabilis]MBI6323781.1 acyltransferase [Proteus mirabilis]HCT9041385.1 acyltransferase [Proteus mirabilis]HEI8392062.1 acyltransferase [Proteus mirabilis]